MKAAINACTWGGYAQFTGGQFSAEAGYDDVEVGGDEEFLGTAAGLLASARQEELP